LNLLFSPKLYIALGNFVVSDATNILLPKKNAVKLGVFFPFKIVKLRVLLTT